MQTIADDRSSLTSGITNNLTLDNRHMQAHSKLVEQQGKKKVHEETLLQLETDVATYVRRGVSNLSDDEFSEYQSLLDRRKHLEAEISRCKDCEMEVEYMLDTADIIFKYYDIIEHGDSERSSHTGPSSQRQCAPTTTAASAKQSARENSILRYFMAPSSSAPPAKNPSAEDVAESGEDRKKSDKDKVVSDTMRQRRKLDLRGDIDRNEDSSNALDRASLLDMYLEKTDPNHFRSTPHENFDTCAACGHVGRTVLPNDGLSFCNSCSAVETVLIDHEKPSYKDPPKEITYFAYKRINHLNEWISQIQGKESTEIPPEIYDKILLEIRKQRITNMADVTNAKIREILKKLGQNRFYEHGAHIMNRLNGMPSISLSPEIEDKLRQMFKMIQIPFFKHAPRNRKNFLSYSYTLHKCLQLLELDEYLKYFPLLKSREKTHAMDEVWKKICADLSWHYYPSV